MQAGSVGGMMTMMGRMMRMRTTERRIRGRGGKGKAEGQVTAGIMAVGRRADGAGRRRKRRTGAGIGDRMRMIRRVWIRRVVIEVGRGRVVLRTDMVVRGPPLTVTTVGGETGEAEGDGAVKRRIDQGLGRGGQVQAEERSGRCRRLGVPGGAPGPGEWTAEGGQTRESATAVEVWG